MQWVAFDSTGQAFSNQDGLPSEAPRDVVCIAQQQQDPTNSAPLILGRCDWFAFHDGRWFDHDIHGLLRAIQLVPCEAVRQGVYLPDERTYKIIEDKARSIVWAA